LRIWHAIDALPAGAQSVRSGAAKPAPVRLQPMGEDFAADLLQMQQPATIDATDD
jgi:hypothetical protein